jgi:hypothetical protein
MPLKLNIGISKKVGLPNYGSLGASCHVEVELDSQLLARDPDEFQQQVQQSFEACSQAVQEELTRQVPAAQNGNAPGAVSDNQTANHVNGQSAGASASGGFQQGQSRSLSRRATAAQVRAIFAIANRQGVDLPHELHNRFGIDRPDDLSVGEASTFIDELQMLSDGSGGSR